MKLVTIKVRTEHVNLRELPALVSACFPRAASVETSVEDVQDWKIVQEDDLYFLVDGKDEDSMLNILVFDDDGEPIYDYSPGNGYKTQEKAEKVRRRLMNGEVRGVL